MRPTHQPIKFRQVVKLIAAFTAVGVLGYVLLWLIVEGPHIYKRWQKQQRWEQAQKQAYEKLSPEDKALVYKFRGLRGGQLVVDAFGEKNGVNIFDEQGRLVFKQATVSPRNRSTMGYGGTFGVPKTLRVEWRDRYLTAQDPYVPPPPEHVMGAYRGGTLLGNYTVPVASRIPDALLEDLRKNGGGFRLKIRIHEDGVLIGWDIQRAYGSAPDGSREHQVGGDFREAYGIDRFDKNGRIGPTQGKGWYIHPKTGQRIETDF